MVQIKESAEIDESITLVRKALELYLGNNFNDSLELLSDGKDQIYTSVAYALYHFIEAIMRFDKVSLKNASEICKNSLQLVNNKRKIYSWKDTLFLGEGVVYTDEELHAEVLSAYCLLFKSALIFLQDDKFSSFLKAALSIRSSYRIFRYCEGMTVSGNSSLDREFQAGVKLGLGLFHMVLSTLTPKVVHLLEVAGFRGAKTSGVEELVACSKISDTLFSSFARNILTSWNLLGSYIFGIGGPVIQPQIVHATGILDLYFLGRQKVLAGEFAAAANFFQKSLDVLGEKESFKVACYWELFLLHSYNSDHVQALQCANHLHDFNWSHCVFSYVRLICTLACNNGRGSEETDSLARNIDSLRQRIAGRAVPFEKYCSRRAEWILEGKRQLFAKWEFIYMWNSFEPLSRSKKCTKQVVDEVEAHWKEDHRNDQLDELCYDLIRGVCYRILGELQKAESCFDKIIRNVKKLPEYYYFYPFALYEMSRVKYEGGKREESTALLKKILHKKKFLLENKVHTRARCMLKLLNEQN